MTNLGHSLPARASEFMQPNGDIVPIWYQQFVYSARAAISTGEDLALEPRPFVTHRSELVKEMLSVTGLNVSSWPVDLRVEEE
jgi:hypothetical protein